MISADAERDICFSNFAASRLSPGRPTKEGLCNSLEGLCGTCEICECRSGFPRTGYECYLDMTERWEFLAPDSLITRAYWEGRSSCQSPEVRYCGAYIPALALVAHSTSGSPQMPSVASTSPAACAPSVTLLSTAGVQAIRMHLPFDRSQKPRFRKKGARLLSEKHPKMPNFGANAGGIRRRHGLYQITC